MPAIGTICQYELYEFVRSRQRSNVKSARHWPKLAPGGGKAAFVWVAINVRSWSMDIASNIYRSWR
jgi:hypothetical protein